ncbi:hypothetical protein IMY05_010G0185000 [Salix suchowensis]|nr:hypothetical protein IMY05_010G0185000 [Salix suchowensis]
MTTRLHISTNRPAPCDSEMVSWRWSFAKTLEEFPERSRQETTCMEMEIELNDGKPQTQYIKKKQSYRHSLPGVSIWDNQNSI